MYKIKITIVCAVVVLLGFTRTATAQAPPSGLTITPFLIEAQMEKGQSIEREVELINNNPFSVIIDPQVYDFLPDGTSGQQAFFEPGEADPAYSLASWLTPEKKEKVSLEPGASTKYRFSISAPIWADNGGHYGAILFRFEQVGAPGSAVIISQKIGTLILVKLGKAEEDGSISKFGTSKSLYEFPPITFQTRFKNTGNVHVKPRGSITIYNSFGKKVGVTKVNENANNVLPNSERVFESTWDNTFAIGRYTAETKLTFGDTGALVTAQTSFWIIPWRIALGAILGLFVLGILFIRGTRRYNRWVVRQANLANARNRQRQPVRVQRRIPKKPLV